MFVYMLDSHEVMKHFCELLRGRVRGGGEEEEEEVTVPLPGGRP